MFSKTSIRFRLIGAMSFLCLLILITGLEGLYSMALMNNSVRDINDNIIPSATAIANSQLAMSRARLVADRVMLHPEAQGAQKTLQRAENFLSESNAAWAAYKSLPQDKEEKQLAIVVDEDRNKFINEAFIPLLKLLRNGDTESADRITMTMMQPLFSKLSESSTALDKFQSRNGAEYYIENQASYHKQILTASIIIGIGVLLTILICFSLLRVILVPLEKAKMHFNSIADGRLTNIINIEGAKEMAELMNGISAMQSRLATTVRGVQDSTASMAMATNEIATGNLELSQRTEQQAASLEETASSLEQLTVAVKYNSENAKQSNLIAKNASATAITGGKIIFEMTTTMDAIRLASTKIEDIIGLIDGIAFQTNILALNAAVEAARAGEQGRGFAVVASEVRNLAQRSKAAAQDVKVLIADSVCKVNDGGRQVAEASVTMSEIVTSIGQVSCMIKEISDASIEQGIGIEQINRAVASLDDMTQKNAALVEEAAAASESLKKQADSLADVIGVFKLENTSADARGLAKDLDSNGQQYRAASRNRNKFLIK